ncbi:MAG: Mur ligase family protein, partial [Candidatus Methylumidiphilus sp.]
VRRWPPCPTGWLTASAQPDSDVTEGSMTWKASIFQFFHISIERLQEAVTMIFARSSDSAGWIGAELFGPDVEFSGVDTDSRHVRPDALFVALKGARYDGHDHLDEARSRGAAAAQVARHLPTSLPLLVAEDTVPALGRLAAAWMRRFHLPVIAVLGSNGKTTVKELAASIFMQREGNAVLATQGNRNNAIGIPLTLFDLDPRHRAAILELGASGPGEITCLGKMALPDLAIITNAGLDHLAGFGGRAGAARANGEIFSVMDRNGIAVLNGDDECLTIWRKQAGTPGPVYGSDSSRTWRYGVFGGNISTAAS